MPPRDCVAIPKISTASAPLSFRPQGEILDPSHPFGMTTRHALRHSLPAEETSINRDRVVTVCNRRHVAVDAVLFAPLDELPANFRIFILVFDQGAAFA